MIFLIRYDRLKGQLVSQEVFSDWQRTAAANRRLELEIELNRVGITQEIVLLEASSQEALRRTHRRYFESAGQIATSTGKPAHN